MGLEALFAPRAVAVIGASSRALTIGHRIIQNLLEFGYTGPVYPVNPKGGEIRGLPACTSILETPDPVDVAHMVIKNTLVPACLEECAVKGVKVVIINTAGFREIGPQGAALEDRLLDIARRTGIRIFGPNCQGIINTDPAVRAYCNFTFTRPPTGHISIVAQSGGVGEVIHQRLAELGAGVRQYASNGNACDVSIPEIVLHYGQDQQTKIIVVHIESLPDPRAFLDAARRVARNKPILAFKAGRTEEGARAVTSHTGGMMTQQTAIELAFEKAGLVSFRNLEDLCQAAVGFAHQPVPAGNRVGMIANTGGPAIIATDQLIESGMIMPPLSDKTEAFLREKLYPEAAVNNPVDVLATAGPEHFAAAIQALAEEDRIDALFLNFVTPFFVDALGIAREIAEASTRSQKPIVATVMTEKKTWAETLRVIREAGVPTYDMPETAARVLASMARYAALKRRPVEAPDRFSDLDTARARAIVGPAAGTPDLALPAERAYELLSCYRIPVAAYAIAPDVEGCLAAAERIGYPVVLKADAPTILHKTEGGAVILDIREPDSLRRAARQLADRLADASPTFLVQEKLSGGPELIVGAKAVEGLGHVLMFGLGGIYVEALEDVSFKLAPVSEREAREMIESVRAHRLLKGLRGRPAADIDALVEIVQRISRMLGDNPEIRELDLNPLFAFPRGAKAADVRVMF